MKSKGVDCMAFFYGLNSSTSSSFFSSMLGTGSSSNMLSSFYSSLGDYAAIKNGSYAKLVKAYYAQQADESDKTSTKKTHDKKTEEKTTSGWTGIETANLTSAERKAYATVKTEANALKSDASELLARGSKSLFRQKDVKDEETGETSKAYDTDKIYKAVKGFVDDYNSLVGTTAKSSNSSILQKNVSMVRKTESYEKDLKAVGITINSDNTLSVDEGKFKASNIVDIKNLFNTSTSFGAGIYQNAAEIENLASSAASSDSLYNSNASYNSITGSLYNGYL